MSVQTANHSKNVLFNKAILVSNKKYTVRLAKPEEKAALFALRFRVFAEELNECLPENVDTGTDKDAFDDYFHHLIAVHNETEEIIGTYRLQTIEDAQKGFYSDLEFDLKGLSDEVLSQAVEMGRACIAPNYRNSTLLLMLWRGIAQFLSVTEKRYLFGCCSINSKDPLAALWIEQYLLEQGYIAPSPKVAVRSEFYANYRHAGPVPEGQPEIPKLLGMYLKHGGKICSEAAYDKDFGTYDFFAFLDTHQLNHYSRKLFFTN